MRDCIGFAVAVAFVMAMSSGDHAGAGGQTFWEQDGVLVCERTREGGVTAVSDGNGGAIISWGDDRGPLGSVYAQRVDEHGNCLWQEGGVCLRANTLYPDNLCSVTDGEGGAIVVWEHSQGGRHCILAQKVDSAGGVLWGPEVEINCWWGDAWYYSSAVSDGRGGAIVAWTVKMIQDTLSWKELRMQRVDRDGELCWGSPVENGVLVATDPSLSFPPLEEDGNHGAMVAWTHTGDVFAQWLDSTGSSRWVPGGIPVCTLDSSQWAGSVTRCAPSSWFVAWLDGRNGDYDLYAQHVDSMGSPMWSGDGMSVALTDSLQRGGVSISDDRNGMIVFWTDFRDGAQDIYCQRVDSSGTALWSANGALVCTAADTAHQLWTTWRPTSDERGGAIVVWKDYRAENWDIYCQRMDSTGTQKWGVGGLAVCIDSAYQGDPVLVPDGQGGAVVAWADNRDGGCVYAQRVGDATGIEPKPIPQEERLLSGTVYPNPFTSAVAIRYALPRKARVKVVVYDAAGRLVRTLTDQTCEPGYYQVNWKGDDSRGRHLSSGTYFIRMESKDFKSTRKVVLMR